MEMEREANRVTCSEIRQDYSASGLTGAAMEIFSQACQAYASGLATLNGELMSFVTTRLKHDAELGRALAKCSDWADAWSADGR